MSDPKPPTPKPPTRHQRREARIAGWRPPLTARRRVAAYFDMLFVDHGVFRYLYLNLHRFSPSAWRSAQPGPMHVARYARLGIRTVATARAGREFGSWPLEVEACERHGLHLADFVVFSRALPSREFLLAARERFAAFEKPVLFHCKSGADRAGFVAALYRLLHDGVPAAEAQRQLHWRFGHFRFAKTGVLDAFFDAYREEGEAKGMSFEAWARDVYDPARIAAAFRPHWLTTIFVDRVLRRE